MTQREILAYLMIALGLALLFATQGMAASDVDPADINPLAEQLGWLLAVPGARLFAVGLLTLACLALAHHPGSALLLFVLAGVVLIAPDAARQIIARAADLSGGVGP